MPKISPPYTSKLTSSSTLVPSGLRTERWLIAKRRVGSCGVVRLMFSSTFWPTIISVRLDSVAVAVSTVPTYSPLRKIATRSETESTSCSLWVMMTTALPSAFMLRITANSFSVSCGVSTAVGSSRIRISAPRNSTFTISSVCFWLTLISYTFWSRSSANWYFSQIARALSRTRRRSNFSPLSMLRAMFSTAVNTSTSLKCW